MKNDSKSACTGTDRSNGLPGHPYLPWHLEVNAADQAGETAVVAESADSADETEVDAGIASQDFDDASQNPVVNGVDPMSLDGVIQLDDGTGIILIMENGSMLTVCIQTVPDGGMLKTDKLIFHMKAWKLTVALTGM